MTNLAIRSQEWANIVIEGKFVRCIGRRRNGFRAIDRASGGFCFGGSNWTVGQHIFQSVYQFWFWLTRGFDAPFPISIINPALVQHAPLSVHYNDFRSDGDPHLIDQMKFFIGIDGEIDSILFFVQPEFVLRFQFADDANDTHTTILVSLLDVVQDGPITLA